jgi:Domain of unknown function (DUF3842)
MTICVVDGRGGGLGSRIVEGLRSVAAEKRVAVLGLGLNRSSAQAMARAGATRIETEEQAIHRQLGRADMIVGSLSLLMPGAMLGEVTPALAKAVLESNAHKVLLPVNRRKVEVVGAEGRTLDSLIEHAIQRILRLTRPAA